MRFQPGEKWEYSNTGYLLLATIIERSSGQPFHQYLQEQIFQPAGMSNTSVYQYVAGIDSNMPWRAYGFRVQQDKGYVFNDMHYLNNVQGDGGVYSTLEDLFKWDRILYTEKLIPSFGVLF